jgi:hypothetical protein
MKYIFLFILVICCKQNFSQHTIVLKNGQKLNGVVFELKNDTLDVAINQQLKKVPLIHIQSIFFNEYIPYDGKLLADEPEKTMRSGNYIIGYRMKDREMTVAPIISIGTEDKGTVVVDVTINRSGTVIYAKAGAPGSTTSNEYLYTKAKFAAQGAKFSESPKGPVEQKGTISITY